MQDITLTLTGEEVEAVRSYAEYALRREHKYHEFPDHVLATDKSGGVVVADTTHHSEITPALAALLNGLVRGARA